jgi:hypothetical protein
MFAPNYRRHWNWAGDHFFAASASMIARTLRPLGYRSVLIDWNNIILVDERTAAGCEVARFANADIAEQYALGYRDRIGREYIFSWNENVARWLTMTDDPPALLRDVHVFMSKTKTFLESPDASFT